MVAIQYNKVKSNIPHMQYVLLHLTAKPLTAIVSFEYTLNLHNTSWVFPHLQCHMYYEVLVNINVQTSSAFNANLLRRCKGTDGFFHLLNIVVKGFGCLWL